MTGISVTTEIKAILGSHRRAFMDLIMRSALEARGPKRYFFESATADVCPCWNCWREKGCKAPCNLFELYYETGRVVRPGQSRELAFT